MSSNEMVSVQCLTEAIEDESRRTARQIHDGAGQILFTLQLALAELMASLPRQWTPQINRAVQLADHLDQQLRSLSRDLYPVALDDLGLNAAVRHLLEGTAAPHQLRTSFQSTVPDHCPSPVVIALYRAVHEGITNVVRHARATEVAVSIDRTARGIVCTVVDNGVGFDSGASRPFGLGLRGIRDRLSGLHGELQVHSAPGYGTELVIFIPATIGEQLDGNQSANR